MPPLSTIILLLWFIFLYLNQLIFTILYISDTEQLQFIVSQFKSEFLCSEMFFLVITFENSSMQDIFFENVTERRGWVVNTHAYSVGLGLKSRPGNWLSWLSFSLFSSVPPGELRDSSLKLSHDHILPNNLQFIIHLSPFSFDFI
jgi:hypothetical protein